MPVAMPTPSEFQGLSWRSRDRAVITARALLRAYAGQAAGDCTVDGYRTRRDRARAEDIAYGENVRAEARRLEQGA